MTQRFAETTTIDQRGNIEYTAVEEVSDALNANLEAQADPNNGFTAERTMRKIADIPVSAFHQWALKIGYYAMPKVDKWRHMKILLRDHPEYATVDRLKHNTVNQGNIIIR